MKELADVRLHAARTRWVPPPGGPGRGSGWTGCSREGTAADFVVYGRDPLEDLSVLAEPERVVLRGRVVA